MNIFHAEKVHDAVVKTTKATAIASAVLVSANTIAQDDMMIEEVIVSAQKENRKPSKCTNQCYNIIFR